MSLKTAIFALLLIASALGQDALTPRNELKDVVTMAPVAPVGITPGKATRVELSFRVASGYHINSSTPNSEYLIPTTLRLDAPNGVIVKVVYPEGQDLTFPFSPNEKLNVYTGDFTISAVLSAAHGTPVGPFRVHGKLISQACDNKACYPPKTLPVAFDVRVRTSSGARR